MALSEPYIQDLKKLEEIIEADSDLKDIVEKIINISITFKDLDIIESNLNRVVRGKVIVDTILLSNFDNYFDDITDNNLKPNTINWIMYLSNIYSSSFLRIWAKSKGKNDWSNIKSKDLYDADNGPQIQLNIIRNDGSEFILELKRPSILNLVLRLLLVIKDKPYPYEKDEIKTIELINTFINEIKEKNIGK